MSKKQRKYLKAIRGLDRTRHFSEGGTLVEWMGGPHTVTKNKKKYRRPAPGQKIM
jgi:hypothetical protein